MLRKEKDGVVWLEFELFGDIKKMKHGVFLRHGGVSKAPYKSLNVGLSCGDNEQHVLQNRRKIMDSLEIQILKNGFQCHGKRIVEAEADDKYLYDSTDGLATILPQVGLLITHADCQAAIIYDPINHAVANVHAGWRGNVQNIYSETVEFMKRCFGSKPENLLVGISPSLGPNNAEFANFREELPEPFWDFQTKPFHFDLWEIGHKQLTDAGVLSHHIEIARMCTVEGAEDFYSFRREKVTGRHGTVALLL